jgi:hypothetical protein
MLETLLTMEERRPNSARETSLVTVPVKMRWSRVAVAVQVNSTNGSTWLNNQSLDLETCSSCSYAQVCVHLLAKSYHSYILVPEYIDIVIEIKIAMKMLLSTLNLNIN